MQKKLFVTTTLILLFLQFNTSQAQNFSEKDNRWVKGWTNFSPNKTDYPEAEEKLPHIISSHMYLRNDIVYFMSGDVYVTNEATLTIQEGTVIRCDHKNPANLIVTKGAKLIALGSKAYPIVFTSNKAPKSRNNGDWGGIIIAGSGKVNTVSGNGLIDGNFQPQYAIYGGNQYNEETTILSHVRIEFAGNTVKRKEGANGLSLYGIGSSSVIDHVMISYSGQDSFNFHGGSNNMQNLISLKAKENDYSMSEGFKGNLSHVIAIRHPLVSSPKGSYAIEIDGYNKETGYIRPDDVTDVTFSNADLINLSNKSNYQHTTAAISTTNSGLTYIHNSKISGFSDVVKFDRSYTSIALIKKSFMMDNSFFNIHSKGVDIANQSLLKESLDILKYNRFTESFVGVDDLFSDPKNNVIPKFQLKKSLNTYMVMQ
ncbi:hypothetical protein J8281_09725 [Aquimarina sp. U1-2]|uniref:hypothetical protein n=1 Tax=Aquimarina sp. U1-2 TaxID=2823141 RepID=UPI001AECE71E|nr:hypothetical protein [Aquimarina sp. U1-2]MBP2832461.1 hypothetical protein [Aquimarina sp. U1-2]